MKLMTSNPVVAFTSWSMFGRGKPSIIVVVLTSMKWHICHDHLQLCLLGPHSRAKLDNPLSSPCYSFEGIYFAFNNVAFFLTNSLFFCWIGFLVWLKFNSCAIYLKVDIRHVFWLPCRKGYIFVSRTLGMTP